MLTAIPSTDRSPNAAREMTRWEWLRSRVSIWWTLNITRCIPHLVWYGDELDALITFKDPDPQAMHKADEAMRDLGLEFDAGWWMDPPAREWEWDYCLRGPVSVKFKGRAKHPDHRVIRPKPMLVEPGDAA